MAKLVVSDEDDVRFARQQAQLNRIVDAFRTVLPPGLQQAVLDHLDGRTTPPPGGARLALVEGGPATDDELEPFGPDDDYGDVQDVVDHLAVTS